MGRRNFQLMGWIPGILAGILILGGIVGCSDDGKPAGISSKTQTVSNGAGKVGVMLKVLAGRGVTVANAHKASPGKRLNVRADKAKKHVLVDVLLQASTAALPKLKNLGVDVRTVTSSGIMSATMPLAKVKAVAALGEVSRIEAAKRKRMYNDLSNAAPAPGCTSCVGMNNTRANQGLGTVVGVIDSGADWTHGDFIDGAGNSRIRYYWDQSDTDDDALPSGSGWSFSYGHEYTNADFDTYIGGNTTAVKASAQDTDGHGTHVLGTAAGDGSASGKMGVAPQADIVFVKFDFDGDRNSDAAIIDGIDYIFRRAAQLGKPAVINMSLGSDFGPHDGTTLEERGVSDLTGRGKVVMVAAGNPGANNWSDKLAWGFAMHGSGQMGNGGDAITFRFPSYTPGADNYVFFDIWVEGNNKCKVYVTPPNLSTYPPGSKRYKNTWVTGSPYTGFNTSDGAILVGNGGDQLDWSTNNGDHEIYVEISDYYGTNPATGTWTIEIVPPDKKSTCAGTYHAWYGLSSNMVSAFKAEPLPRDPTPKFGGNQPDNVSTIGSPASADKVLAVAAYQSRNTWDYVYGTGTSCSTTPASQSYGTWPIDYYDPYQMGDLAYFSGRGPRRDNVLKPEIATPGVGIASAFSHFTRAQETDKCTDYWSGGPYHYGLNRVLPGEETTILQGTSMACPNATGAVALLLQQKGDLDDACLRKVFANSAFKDSATETFQGGQPYSDTDNSATPNNDWGHGKLDITAALAYLTASGYSTCIATCETDADCGGGTCQVTADACGCNTCTQGPDCSADGTCNAQCAPGADPDCAPDCSADGTCNAQCAPGADPDCAPDCSADGTCNVQCAPGADPDCSTCLSLGASCNANGDCCSNKCKGKPGKKTCK